MEGVKLGGRETGRDRETGAPGYVLGAEEHQQGAKRRFSCNMGPSTLALSVKEGRLWLDDSRPEAKEVENRKQML